jgi:hypothetical protein
MLNEQFTWLTPLSQLETPGFPGASEGHEGSCRQIKRIFVSFVRLVPFVKARPAAREETLARSEYSWALT